MLFASVYDKGPVALKNQDAILYEQVVVDGKQVVFAAICDGIGGLQEGEKASFFVTLELRKFFYEKLIEMIHKRKGQRQMEDALNLQIKKCGKMLRRYGEVQNLQLGTTLTAILFYRKKYTIFHIGDSRAYLVGKRLRQITEDDVYENGSLSKCVGSTRYQPCQIYHGRIGKRDCMLLCSDGFRKELMPEEIRGFLQSDRHMAENILQKRLQKALETCRLRGEKDNVSAMVIGW